MQNIPRHRPLNTHKPEGATAVETATAQKPENPNAAPVYTPRQRRESACDRLLYSLQLAIPTPNAMKFVGIPTAVGWVAGSMLGGTPTAAVGATAAAAIGAVTHAAVRDTGLIYKLQMAHLDESAFEGVPLNADAVSTALEQLMVTGNFVGAPSAVVGSRQIYLSISSDPECGRAAVRVALDTMSGGYSWIQSPGRKAVVALLLLRVHHDALAGIHLTPRQFADVVAGAQQAVKGIATVSLGSFNPVGVDEAAARVSEEPFAMAMFESLQILERNMQPAA